MDFLDEDPVATATHEVPQGPQRRRGGRGPRPPRQQIMVRRGIAVAAGLLVLILLVLGVRGCLNARKERALEDYAQGVAEIVDETQQVSDSFFGQLEDPGSLRTTEYQDVIAADRSALDSLLSRTEQLDVPGDMNDAQEAFELTMRLRRDALTVISTEVPNALGTENRIEAIDRITNQMETFLASDVVYRQIARPEMERVLSDEGIEEEVPESQFLPDSSYLDSTTIEDALSQVSGTSAATPGIHGLGLLQTSANGQVIEEGVPVTVPAGGQPELDVEVQNQGDSEETGVTVSVVVDGGEPIEQEISTIAPGETQTVKIPLTPAPQGEATIEIEVVPVPGEQVSDNNAATYTVTFQ